MVVGTETLMNTTHGLLRGGLWLTYLVMLLALLCASLTGCHSRAAVMISATAMPPVVTGNSNPLAGMTPAQPIDERPITPMETVGASGTD
jgi:hypothetical protein